MHSFNLAKFCLEQYGSVDRVAQLSAPPFDKLLSFPGIYLAGGAVRRIIQNKLLDSDFDFFCLHEAKSVEFLNYVGSISDKLTVRKNNVTIQVKSHELQLINFTTYEDIESIINSFDFTICQFLYEPLTNLVHCGDYSMYDLGRNRLRLHKMTYPVATLRRLIKYTKQGFYACDGTLSQILKSSCDVILDNPSALDFKYID